MEYTLQHHGVKGMKWGVRKAQYKTGKSLIRQYNKLQKKTADNINYSAYYDDKSKNRFTIGKNTYKKLSESTKTQAGTYQKQGRAILSQLKKMGISTIMTKKKRRTVTEANPYMIRYRTINMNKLKLDKNAYKKEKNKYKTKR